MGGCHMHSMLYDDMSSYSCVHTHAVAMLMPPRGAPNGHTLLCRGSSLPGLQLRVTLFFFTPPVSLLYPSGQLVKPLVV